MRLSLEASAGANLEALIGLPIEVTAGQSYAQNDVFEASHVAAAIVQPYFTISVSCPPWDLVEGTPPADAVVVSNVIYGRMAFITASAVMASRDLSAKVDRIINAVDLASAEATASAELSAILSTGSLKVRIIGGSSVTGSAASVGTFQEFKNHITQLDPTVQGSLGVPLAYIFRYVSDDAPVFIKGSSEFDRVECRRTKRLKIANAAIKVSKVSDFGDEELYGTIKLTFDGDTKDLWSQSSFVSKGHNQSIVINAEPEFRVDPTRINNARLEIAFNVKDKIMRFPDPEEAGASDQAKRDGFVKYSPGTIEFNVKDAQNASGGTLTKNYTLTEGSAELKVAMTFKLLE
jgi:hypothetical protein